MTTVAYTLLSFATKEVYEDPQISSNLDSIDSQLTYSQIAPRNNNVLNSVDLNLAGPRVERTRDRHISPQSLSFRTDWFNQIHVIPGILNLGNVLNNEVRTVEVFNAYTIQQTLSSIDDPGITGVNLIQPFTPPENFDPLESAEYQVQIDLEGPPTISATFTFNFTNIGAINLQVNGARVIVWSFIPQTPITERLEFLTDVIESHDGEEQRISLRKRPRQIIELTNLQNENFLSRMNAVAFEWTPRVFALPIWWEMTPLVVAANASDTQLNFDTNYMDLRDDSLLILWTDDATFETVEIDTVNADNVTIKQGLQQGHAQNTFVMPIRNAYVEDDIRSERYRVGPATMRTRFTTIDNVDLSAQSISLAFPTYLNLPVLNDPNYVDGNLGERVVRRPERFDPQTGPIFVDETRPEPQTFAMKTFITDSKQSTWEHRVFLHTLRGQQKTFWLPNYRPDFVVTGTIASSATVLTVENTGYTVFYRSRTPRNHIMIRLKDGTDFYREITGSSEVDVNNETITIDTALAQEIQPNEIEFVSFLNRSRLASDAVNFRHETLKQATISFPTVDVLQ